MEVGSISQVAMRLDVLYLDSFFSDKSPQPSTSPIEEMLMVYAAAISLVLLVSHLVGSKIVAHVRKTPAEPAIVTEVSQNPFKKHVSQLGGGWIFTFMGLRLVLSSALTLLSFVSAFKSGDSTRRIVIALSITSAYTVILTALSMLTPVKWSDVLTRHANTLWLISFTVFGYRDLYPSATFDLTPLDIEEGWFIWVKIALLFILAIVIPLAIPRRYIPHNPKEPSPNPAPEQTASLFSLVFYFFLDPIVFEARTVSHLPYDHLPPLADYDYAKNLRLRAFKHLDRFSGLKKRRHLFFSLMRIFWKEYSIMALMTMLQAGADLSTPIGVNQLLRYIENKGVGTTVRPWVWVLWLLLGPTISSIAFEWYIFVSTRSIVHTESIITQVVFEHALRIRVKAETSKSEADQQPRADTASLADTSPTSASSGSQDGDEDGSDDETLRSATHSREETLQASSTSGSQSHAGSLKGVPGAKGPAPVAGGSSPTKPPSPANTKSSESSKNLVGKLNNLVSTDLQNIVDAKDFVRLFALVPIQVVLCIWFLYGILGYSAFVGLAVIIILFPVPGSLTRFIQKAQKARMKRTDARVQVVTEIMNVLRMVKMFGWEKKMNERIGVKREEEISFIKRLRLLGMMTAIANHIIPVLTILELLLILFSTLVMGKELTASKVFSSMVVFDKFSNLLRMMIFLTTQSLNGKVSLDRITDFLYDTELLDSWSGYEAGVDATIISSPPPTPDAIGFRNATFAWSAEDENDGSHTPSRRKFLLKIQDELFFKKGVINMIVGPTGSGKTSVLMALLSEMHFVPSSPESWYGIPRASGIAYAAQESWVQNATIRDNIVFGAEFDEARYKKVIYQCCLERDLTLFEAGDQTEVGEKGLTLSGGQKARVTLARAVYSQAETILLDDVLAALDVHTSKWIVEKCFKGDLIRGRTVLLVTHNVVLVQPIAKFVVSIKDGRVASQTSIEEAISSDEALAAEVEKDEEAVERAADEIDPQSAPNEPSGKDGKLILKEEVELGHVSWTALKLFFTSMGGNHVSLFFFTFVSCFLAAELAENGQTYFLGYWARQYELVDNPSQVNVPLYIAIYVAILVFLILTFCIGFVVYLWGVLRASRIIHERLVTSVIGTTLRWLDTTPTSRVITRCTQDIRDVDDPLAQMFSGLIQMSLAMAIKFLAVIFFTPAFILPATFVGLFGAWCGNIYIKAQLPVKREMSNAKAPVLGHFGAAMTGLTSIRAYGVEESFRNEVQVRIDHYARPSRSFYNLNRWIDVRVDAISNVFAAALAAYLIYAGKNASDTGFVLNMAVGFSGTILWWIRIVNQFEVRGNSLERIGAYIAIEQEKSPVPEGVPPAYWPASGDLRVQGLSASYSPDGPKVLKDLSFEVKSGERIGVVGRTGSGKSSLMLSLTSADLLGWDCIPELLSGSVRENLDPFGEQDDALLNSALRSAGLFSLQEEMEEGEDRITLDSAVSSGGNNLSVGQRQIIALARAMVRESKLLILDEATSAIDYKTDSVIQSSLRHELDNDVTLITVAHRLQTIMDADKIMVLDAGQIVEFDRPAELLKDNKGKLRALVDESADKEHLIEMVKAKEHLDHQSQS
ncbi:hypothetical protein BT96DRAFT_996727 [Gymnopus androsaceus JB14]|uniref:P-loop containing nucleoside triphosphate hydrolase protein n=1 Tax=Gymnopus androsaceus JB14 TaxID=1447944 RepID=A0A6A4HFE4_9AGAR|nr:hypothetical protein BT96DRAFT_996727 [Gymnopus androsaceus JB14]